MTNALQLIDICFNFKGKIVLDKTSLTVNDSHIHTIIGTTGSGKSVLLKIISNMLNPQSGQLIKDNNKNLSFVFQDNPFLSWLSIRKNLELASGSDIRFLEEWIQRFKLKNYLDHFPNELSGGTKQKFNLLRAFIHHPQYILMDEPFSHLDQIQKEDLYNFTLALWNDYKPTIILVTHDIDEALYLSHQISFLSKIEHKIIKTLKVKEFEAKHSDDLVTSKSDTNYLNHFNSVYTLYKLDGRE